MCQATQHGNHFQGGRINSLSFHQFFCWSQLTDESKGGYLKGNIQVPIGINKIELALFARDGRNPYPNLSFVTPDIKQTGEKHKEITAHDYKVIQGPQSLSVISNLVLTDRKKAINIKIMVNPVKGRWEIYA